MLESKSICRMLGNAVVLDTFTAVKVAEQAGMIDTPDASTNRHTMHDAHARRRRSQSEGEKRHVSWAAEG